MTDKSDLPNGKTVEIRTLSGIAEPRKCSSPKCDGRPARWFFPQTWLTFDRHAKPGYASCGVHLAAFASIVSEYHA